MFDRIKRMLQGAADPQRWDEAKSAALVGLLGAEHDVVMHAIIPFAIGGALDLYFYQRDPGFAIATKELIDERGKGPRNRSFRAYELCAFSRVAFDLDRAKDEGSAMGRIHDRLGRILNAVARYAPTAALEPNATMEFPPDFNAIGGQCLVLDAIGPLEILGRRCGLMTVINVHRDEMEFARQHGGGQLIARLKAAGAYPYSDLDRPSVV